ncbi:hypothetical protein QFZ34_001496 [Phyllobacterium ifriqiyense]|uniref:Uncharacterized protein n=1 Tax=Phyllobacterium ifriqiyense TaxID=314238 RepID=A0ABU0S6C6_9HYPH|nr:hypothetical protein [Phyllobacterium ifriqiyense]MDQ0996319.1 hypothetical protein [Phyllobacterium ifriqiyense]
MENYREYYLNRLHRRTYGVVRRLLADVLLLVLIVGFGVVMNSLVV